LPQVIDGELDLIALDEHIVAASPYPNAGVGAVIGVVVENLDVARVVHHDPESVSGVHAVEADHFDVTHIPDGETPFVVRREYDVRAIDVDCVAWVDFIGDVVPRRPRVLRVHRLFVGPRLDVHRVAGRQRVRSLRNSQPRLCLSAGVAVIAVLGHVIRGRAGDATHDECHETHHQQATTQKTQLLHAQTILLASVFHFRFSCLGAM